MKKEQKPFLQRAERFFAGKGFYIVLFLCVAVIGVSAWSMLTGGGAAQREDALGVAAANMDSGKSVAEDASTAPRTTAQPVPPPTAAPSPAPSPSPEPTSAPEKSDAAVPAPAAEVRDYFIWPVAGSIENAYSMTALVFNRTMQDWRTHDGVDIAAELGTQVKAAANGRVAEVRDDDLYGTTVVLNHFDGLQSIYSNLAASPTVAVGETVGVGQVIGAVGDTALCETNEICHLHFAMRKDGVSVDPGEFLP